MAHDARGLCHERIVFSYIRNGSKTVFLVDSGFNEEELGSDFAQALYDENLLDEIITEFEC